MFRRICGGVGGLAAPESAAVQELLESRSTLLIDGGLVDVKSDAGYAACAGFLGRVDEASKALGVDIARREYRQRFSANYRALFPDGGRHYRVDVLEASVDQQEIWVNGEKFELSPLAIECAQDLQASWVALILALDRWQAAATSQAAGAPAAAPKPEKPELVASLYNFDAAWAKFESQYISELIAIEEKARQLVVRAVELESQLQPAETSPATPKAQEIERQFVLFIAQLNSVANFKRKGRDDLGCEILEAARAELRSPVPVAGRSREAARVLAGDIIASYAAMRNYFRKVGQIIEHVDPHLCNNQGLVARLVDWEETWEVGARYVKAKPLLDAVCDLVDEIKAAQKLAPELTTMIEDCDVELFLVLPRLVVLCFLDKPLRERTQLVRMLLPHRFGPAPGQAAGQSFLLDPELKAVYDSFKETMTRLTTSMTTPASGSCWAARHGAWEAIVKHAVLGEEVDLTAASPMAAASPASERGRAITELLRGAERWSLELQRHCPEDWNQCSAILVHCLTGGQQRESGSKFQV